MDSTKLLSSIKSAILVPSYQPRYTDADLLGLANDEQQSLIVSELKSLREDYFTIRSEIAIIAGQSEVYIPERAVGRTARDIRYFTQSSQEYSLPRIQLEDTYLYTNFASGNPTGFSLVGDNIVLLPTASDPGTCVVYYDFRPSAIVSMTRVAKVTAVGIDNVTVAAVPTNITIGSLADITRKTPAYKVTYYDRTITNISGGVITLDGFSVSNPITAVSVGDYISLAQETGLVQLPDEAQQTLIQAVAMRVLEGLNLPDQLNVVKDIYERKIRLMRDLMLPRVEGAVKKIINRNGLLARGSMRRFPSVNIP